MRAIAHRNGCSLLFTSINHKEQLNKAVSLTRCTRTPPPSTPAQGALTSPRVLVLCSSATG